MQVTFGRQKRNKEEEKHWVADLFHTPGKHNNMKKPVEGVFYYLVKSVSVKILCVCAYFVQWDAVMAFVSSVCVCVCVSSTCSSPSTWTHRAVGGFSFLLRLVMDNLSECASVSDDSSAILTWEEFSHAKRFDFIFVLWRTFNAVCLILSC